MASEVKNKRFYLEYACDCCNEVQVIPHCFACAFKNTARCEECSDYHDKYVPNIFPGGAL